MLSGKKTYVLALGVVLSAVGGYLHGDFTAVQALEMAINGGVFAALRSAIAKV